MKPETTFRMRVVKELKKYPNLWFTSVQQVSIGGTPDILMCAKGKLWAVELKSEKGLLSALQAYTLNRIRECGGEITVLYPKDFEDFKLKLKKMMEE